MPPGCVLVCLDQAIRTNLPPRHSQATVSAATLLKRAVRSFPSPRILIFRNRGVVLVELDNANFVLFGPGQHVSRGSGYFEAFVQLAHPCFSAAGMSPVGSDRVAGIG